MGQASLAGDKKTLEFIKSWYDDQRTALSDLRGKVIESSLRKPAPADEKFCDLSLSEVLGYFDASFRELEYLTAFDLLSATEAELRTDFINRVKNKDKSETGRKFRAVDKEKGDKISLEQDILEILKETYPSKKSAISLFTGALKYRHWIAHGRYWAPKLGRIYSVDIIYQISSDMIDILGV
jgi:hypothetical protein